MAAPRKYDDATRKRILELHVHERKSAANTAKILEAEGTPISEHTVRSIAKDERQTDVVERPKQEQLRILLAGLVQATNTEISRINGTKEPADADQLHKLARTIREIEPLLSDKPREKDTDKPKGTLGGLASVPTGEDSATQAAPTAVRSLRA